MRNWIEETTKTHKHYMTLTNNYKICVSMMHNHFSGRICVIHPDRQHYHQQNWLIDADEMNTIEQIDALVTGIAKQYKPMKINTNARYNKNTCHDIRSAFGEEDARMTEIKKG